MARYVRPAAHRAYAWLRARPFLAALLVLAIPVVIGFARLETVADQAHDAAADAELAAAGAEEAIATVEAEATARAREACQSRRDTIVVLRDLVEVSYAGGGLGPIFSSTPGFEDLSPDLRAYLLELERRLNTAPPDDAETAKDRALAVLVLPDCDTDTT